MYANASFPCRMIWACMTFSLLLGTLLASPGCVKKQEDSPTARLPAASPAIAGQDKPSAGPEQPALDTAGTTPADAEASKPVILPPPQATDTAEKPEPGEARMPAEPVPADMGAAQSEPASTGGPSEPKSPMPILTEEDQPVSVEKLDFGEPLIEGLGEKERLAHKQPIWLTKDGKSVVVQAMVCQTEAPLEMFACLLGSKEHESVLAVPVKAFIVHAGLLAAGALAGTPVRFDPQYAPPTGTEIEITVLWKDKDGKVQKARAQDWVQDLTTGKAMAHPWVFAGSRMHKDEETGQEHYLGDSSGDLICVSNFSTATLDVPVQSSDSNAALMFEAFTEHIPPLGTPVTMVLTPKLQPKGSPDRD